MHKSSSIYLVIFGVLLIFTVSYIGAVAFGMTANPLSFFEKSKEDIKVVALPKPTISQIIMEATPAASQASPSAKLKMDITIQILNGSGVTAQAAKTKTLLEGLGFGNIKVGNISGKNSTETVVVFSKDVSTKDRKDIINKLKTLFKKVSFQEGANEIEFDVVITTGSYSE